MSHTAEDKSKHNILNLQVTQASWCPTVTQCNF